MSATPRPTPRATGVTIRVVRSEKLFGGWGLTLAPTVHIDGVPSLGLPTATLGVPGDSLYIDLLNPPDPIVRIS